MRFAEAWTQSVVAAGAGKANSVHHSVALRRKPPGHLRGRRRPADSRSERAYRFPKASADVALALTLPRDYIPAMCGRVIHSSGPLRYAIVDGMNVRDSRVHNYPPRWNAAPSQELLVIRRNQLT